MNWLDNEDSKDKITQYLYRTVDFLMVNNATGTSIGIVIGGFLYGMRDIFSDVIDLLKLLKWYSYFFFGILIGNLPKLITKHNSNEDIETALHYVKKIQKLGNFSEAEKRRQFRELIALVQEKCINSGKNKDNDNLIHE